jgi:hypothetical protein
MKVQSSWAGPTAAQSQSHLSFADFGYAAADQHPSHGRRRVVVVPLPPARFDFLLIALRSPRADVSEGERFIKLVRAITACLLPLME